VLKDKLINFYTVKVSKKATTQTSRYCATTNSLKYETVFKDTNTDKNDLFWIQMYYFIRCKEEKIGMSQSQFDADLRKISLLYTKMGEEATLKWILSKTKKFLDGGTNPTYTQYRSVSQNKSKAVAEYTFSI
jgi:hypothetical protein